MEQNSFENAQPNNIMQSIIGIKDEIIRTGSTDVESNQIDGIIEDLKNGVISPEKALESVQKIQSGRTDYH